MLTLSIHHNIYLTKEQRYGLHNTMDVDTIGVSMPVWFLGEKTSEPGQEIFCKYYLRNPKKELPIKILKDGYTIYLPYRVPPRKQRVITHEEWQTMNQEQREAYYTAQPREMTSASLLDVKDGGCECLMYREVNKVKSGEQYMRIMHYVNFMDMKFLEGTLQYVRSSESESTEGNPGRNLLGESRSDEPGSGA